ncbi:MAG TPA: trifunctional transcriptional activator/DNA repair protein Ada/methylated-DNA--[protein]-cysteine S-methyltransferase [Blastocatellia bacterium]|nr:trifunctional transcriptional activator/DNA repair protein Ada/methylated-DNA--[protein]-cysteine S-methyltransferase [Blastocatellia bacterium]
MNKLPSPQTMYRALRSRDARFEGIFFVGVKTTGVFCRSVCAAKTPKAENVEYFGSPQEAMLAGYRPCLRCRPLDKEKRRPELVRRLCEAVEQAPAGKLSDSDLRGFGIDPSTARRQFRRHFGMTFHAYHRARRMGLALREVRGGGAVISAQVNNGFESASGFWEAFKRVFGEPPSRAGQVDCLQARWIESPLGAMLALADQDGLHLLEFVDRRGLESEITGIRARIKRPIVPGNNAHLDRISRELEEYFAGRAASFTVPLVVGGSAFERGVWEMLQTIEPGRTWSYAQLAERIGNPRAVRAVGRANGRNCLAIVIPCHRVIRADGNLCGYGGGLWRKKWLLEHERRMTGQAASASEQMTLNLAATD